MRAWKNPIARYGERNDVICIFFLNHLSFKLDLHDFNNDLVLLLTVVRTYK